MKRIVRGNDFTLRIPVMKQVGGEKVPYPLPACTDVQVRICNGFARINLPFEIDVEQDNVILARVEGNVPLGTYALEVLGKTFGKGWRSEEYPQFAIVAKNADADTEFGETDEGDNSVEMDTVLVILPPTVELSNLINSSQESLDAMRTLNESVSSEEAKRADAEKERGFAEEERLANEKLRENAERVRESNENNRQQAELMREQNEETRKQTYAAISKNELERCRAEETRTSQEADRNENELRRNDNEEKRISAEGTRSGNEQKRVDAENTRISNEDERIRAENARKDAEIKRETSLSSAVDDANLKVSSFVETSTTKINDMVEDSSKKVTDFVSVNQDKLDSTVEKVGTDTQAAIDDLTTKVNASIETNDAAVKKAIDDFIAHSTAFDVAEDERVKAETARADAEAKRESDFSDAKSECETATDNANTAASDAKEAIKKCETATAGAEKCNVALEGTKIVVTNRNGEKQETEVVDTEEVVTVVITSSVDSISVAGLKVNVFLNNGKTPQIYTTDSEGMTTFKVSRGVYYQVTVPEYANAQPLSPIGFTSVGVSKTITFNYEPYDEETSEKVIVTVTKYTDGTGTPWEGKDVIVTIDKKATTYTTDEKGQATIYMPYLKEYTVRVDDEDGYYVRFNKNSRTYTSRVAQRLIAINMYQFKTGIYVLDSDATEYYIEDWVAAGKSAEEAVAIKVADQNLRLNRGTFIIRCDDLKDMTKLQKYQWCTQNLQFTSIALNGNTSSDPNYWNGEQSSFLVRQEAEERSLSVPAFAFAYGQSLEIGGEKLNGFLMSVGQEYVHISNAGTIREVLRTLFGDTVADAYYKFVNGQYRWTSTQYNAAYAWYYSSQTNVYSKGGSCFVLPVFAC